MTPDSVIVTLQLEDGRPLGDFELPAGLPAGQLAPLVLEALKGEYPKHFARWTALRLTDGQQALHEEETLSSRGIWDGGRLIIRSGE